jgi:rubrerythrin
MGTASDDIMTLFRELLEKEEIMTELYSGMSEKIENPDVRHVVESIIKDEKRHAANARKMIEIAR